MCSAGQQQYRDLRWELTSEVQRRNRADSKRVETAWERMARWQRTHAGTSRKGEIYWDETWHSEKKRVWIQCLLWFLALSKVFVCVCGSWRSWEISFYPVNLAINPLSGPDPFHPDLFPSCLVLFSFTLLLLRAITNKAPCAAISFSILAALHLLSKRRCLSLS